jgi:integrase
VECTNNLADLIAESGGTLLAVEKLTVAGYAADWLAATRKSDLRGTTLAAYEWALGHALPIIGGVRLDKLDLQTAKTLISEMRRTRIRDGEKIEPASDNTIIRVCSTMGNVINDAISDGVFRGANPFEHLGRHKPTHRPEKGRALSLDEARAFIVAARTDKFEAAWIMALTAGLRIGELFGLQWDDIDFADSSVNVRRQATIEKNKLVITEFTKTEAGLRVAPLDTIAIAALKRRQKESAKTRSKWVFASENPDMPTNPNNARKRNFADVVERAGIKGKLVPHDLRHTFNSIANAKGVDEKTRSSMMGHSDSAITRTVYTHVIPGESRKAAKAVNDALKPNRRR